MPLFMPLAPTLKKYGLTPKDWLAMARGQDYVCAICKKLPKSGRLHIDHEHVRGWARMPPEQRRKYVRGLVCYRDNRFFLARGMTAERATEIAKYLGAIRK